MSDNVISLTDRIKDIKSTVEDTVVELDKAREEAPTPSTEFEAKRDRVIRDLDQKMERLLSHPAEAIGRAMSDLLVDRANEKLAELERLDFDGADTTRYINAHATAMRIMRLIVDEHPTFDVSRGMLRALIPLGKARIGEDLPRTPAEDELCHHLLSLEEMTMPDLEVDELLERLDRSRS